MDVVRINLFYNFSVWNFPKQKYSWPSCGYVWKLYTEIEVEGSTDKIR